MFHPHTEFEESTISCNEGIKGNAKCKNSRFEPPFGGLRVTHRVHLRLDGKRVVDFLFEYFSLALMVAALLREICRNQRFLKGWVTLSAIFGGWGRGPQSIYTPSD